MTVESNGEKSMRKPRAIAIDGPAGAGKTSLSKELAKQLGYIYIDTGAIYRSFALHKLWLSKEKGEPVSNSEALHTFDLEFFRGSDGVQHFYIYGKCVDEQLRTPEVSMEASNVGVDPEVRAALLDFQRKQAHGYDCIMEGRDIGTVVLPQADIKIFLTAQPEVRAMRRVKDLPAGTVYEDVLVDIQKRDLQDSTRAIAPLKPAEGAYELDNSNLTFEETVNEVLWLVHSRFK